MLPRALLLLLLAAPGIVCAQEPPELEPYRLTATVGVSGVVRAPFAPLELTIWRQDPTPFTGRIVVTVAHPGARRSFGRDEREFTLIRAVSLSSGLAPKLIRMQVPVGKANLQLEISLEQATGEARFLAVARTFVSHSSRTSPRPVVGFLSTARLGDMRRWLFFDLVEIPPDPSTIPVTWQGLSAFDAILVNRDDLTREQTEALADYVTLGGTLVISPLTSASFNAGTPAGMLLDISPGASALSATLARYPYLLSKLTADGSSRQAAHPDTNGSLRPENPEEPPPAPEASDSLDLLELPDPEAPIRVWQDSGRARSLAPLISVAQLGAGRVVFLHVDISSPPFVKRDEQGRSGRIPTRAAANLLLKAFGVVQIAGGGTALDALAGKNGRDVVDIAGRRIPGARVMYVLLLVYVLLASLGTFLLARRLKRPVLYPVGLAALAALSVALVFGLGEIFKRAGERVKAVRVLVTDESMQRSALFSIGCVYVVSGDRYEFSSPVRAELLPAEMTRDSTRGMPHGLLSHTSTRSGARSKLEMSGLDRWQNIFFVRSEIVGPKGLKVKVTSLEGAHTVENLGTTELRCCILVVGHPKRDRLRAKWHFVESISARGGPDSTATFTRQTLVADRGDELDGLIEGALGAGSLEFQALTGLFVRAPLGLHTLDQVQREYELGRAGLLPADGEFLLISVLPPNTVDPTSLGTSEEVDDIEQVCLWFLRGRSGAR